MAERIRLGLIFNVNPNWMGGTYYILNLIDSFNYLEDEKRPEVILLCTSESDLEYVRNYTQYPYLEYTPFYKKNNFLNQIVNKISNKLFGRNIVSLFRKSIDKSVDVVYPVTSVDSMIKDTRNVGWIPDFQDKYLPQLFHPKTLKYRENNTKLLRDSGIHIVFSSNDARKDYLQFYKGNPDLTYVFRFTSKIPSEGNDLEVVMNKYDIKSNMYLFCGNQFWIHKNHIVLFKAIKLLKDQGYNPILLCTGNPNDNRAKEHFQKIKDYIDENQLQGNIIILGLIERNDQLSLMKNSMAVIQPSLFEGWNTSIEEAKAMNKMLIVSDLEVHKEQVVRNVLFFKRDSVEDLAEKIKDVMDGNFEVDPFDYSKSIKESAETFIQILEDCNSIPYTTINRKKENSI